MSIDGGSYVVMPVTPQPVASPPDLVVNLVPNPSFESGSGSPAGTSDWTITGGAPEASFDVATDHFVAGAKSFHVQTLATGNDAAVQITTGLLPVTPLLNYRFMFLGTGGPDTDPQWTAGAEILWYTSDDTLIGSVGGLPISLFDGVGEVSVSSPSPPNAAKAKARVLAGITAAPPDIHGYVDCCILATYPWPGREFGYFDGDTPDGYDAMNYAWLGTPHASASTRTIP